MFRCLHLILVTVILINFSNSNPVIQNQTNCCCTCQRSCLPCPTMLAQTASTIYFSSCALFCQNQQCCTPTSGVVPVSPINTYQQPCIPPQQPEIPQPTVPPKVKCPEYTINVNNTCQPVFCGNGIYRNGVCIQTFCPSGTVWTGTKCEIPQPHNHTTITILNTVKTSLDYATNHTVNFNNKVDVFIPDVHISITSRPPPPPPSPSRPRPTSCCTVVTPHTCLWDDSQYDCRSRSFRTCSSACSSSYMYLRPPSFMPMPPASCENNDCYNGHRSFYPDCSNCYDASYECRSYCRRRSVCQVRQCQQIDMRSYCGQYPGSMGCREIDGCLDDWCTDY